MEAAPGGQKVMLQLRTGLEVCHNVSIFNITIKFIFK
jgi:hypothetical protein